MFKGTTSIRYDTDLGKFRAYLQGAALYQTNATQDLNTYNNSLLGNTSGFVTFDFSGGIKKDNWTLDLFIQNAFDKRGALTTNTFCSITFCSGSSRTFTTAAVLRHQVGSEVLIPPTNFTLRR
jgi:outer membrane receptor protein involved in Fe transport